MAKSTEVEKTEKVEKGTTKKTTTKKAATTKKTTSKPKHIAYIGICGGFLRCAKSWKI